MLVQSNHFSFVLDRTDTETETMHRAVIQRVRHVLDTRPKHIRTSADIAALVEWVRREVRRVELEMDKGIGGEREGNGAGKGNGIERLRSCHTTAGGVIM